MSKYTADVALNRPSTGAIFTAKSYLYSKKASSYVSGSIIIWKHSIVTLPAHKSRTLLLQNNQKNSTTTRSHPADFRISICRHVPPCVVGPVRTTRHGPKTSNRYHRLVSHLA